MASVARYSASDHLLELVERAGVAAGRISAAPAGALERARAEAVREQARLSARLDGSPLSEDTAAHVDSTGPDGFDAGDETAGPAPGARGWAEALRIDRLPSQTVAAREYANLLACADVEGEVAAFFFDRPLEALTRLHATICRDLVEHDLIARLRRTQRAIHDGAQGQMLWAAPEPERLGGLFDALLEWLGGPSAARPTLVVAAVVHERILEWQPFEAANGRLARAAARVVRRARGLDPLGVAVPEALWHATTLAYHREVAATIRRRGDLSAWIARAAHAEVLALERAADRVLPRPGGVSTDLTADLASFLRELPVGAPVSVRDYAARAGLSRERARAQLAAARRAGLLEDDPTVAGMRYRLAEPVLPSRGDGAAAPASHGD